MPDEFLPALAETQRRARLPGKNSRMAARIHSPFSLFGVMQQRFVPLACLLLSVILHGLPLLWWSLSHQGVGVGGASLRASLQAPGVQPRPEFQPVQAGAQPEAGRPTEAAPAAVPEPAAPAPVIPRSGGAQSALRPEDYALVELLEQRPRFLVDMREYVPASLDPEESGKIVLQLLIGVDGEVDGVLVESTELTPRGTRRFVQRLNALRLEPARHKGVPVRSRWRLEFSFAPLN